MSMAADLLAMVALLPAMTGPAAPARTGDAALVLNLCSGGSMALPTGGDQQPGPAAQPCCAKGCQRDRRRPVRPIDREQ